MAKHTDMNHFPRVQCDEEKRKEWSKEEICHRKARHKPRCAPRDGGGTSPTSALLVVVYERVASTSGWFACIHACRVSAVPHQSTQHPTVDSSPSSLWSRQWFL